MIEEYQRCRVVQSPGVEWNSRPALFKNVAAMCNYWTLSLFACFYACQCRTQPDRCQAGAQIVTRLLH